MKSIVLSFLLAVGATAQSVVLSPEVPVTAPRSGFAALSMFGAQTASDGTNLFVVWYDDRGSLASRQSYDVHPFAARVDPLSRVLDTPNIPIPFGVVGVFWDGREYVVVGAGRYMRISAAGELLDAAPRVFTFTGHPNAGYKVGWANNRVLIVSETAATNGNPAQVDYSLYDGSFNLLQGDTHLSTMSDYAGFAPAIASNGRNFVIASTQCQGFNCTTNIDAVDRDGGILHTGPIAKAFTFRAPAVASDGNHYLVLSQAYDADNRYQFNGLVLNEVVGLYGTAGPFALGNYYASSSFDLAWEGDAYQLVYQDQHLATPGVNTALAYNVGTVTISAAGTQTGGRLLGSFDRSHPPDLVAGGGAGVHYLLSPTHVDSDLYSFYVALTGAVYNDASSTPFTLGQGVLPEEFPASATAGKISLLAWREPVADARDRFAVFAARVDSYGRVLDAAPIQVATSTCDAMSPRVATNGHDFFVIWQDPAGIEGARVSGDGRLLDANALLLSAPPIPACGGASPDVAWNGSTYLVAWAGPQLVNGPSGLNAVRVKADGTVVDTLPIDITRGNSFSLIRVASNGDQFFISWTAANNGASEARGARLSAEGTPLDGAGFGLVVRNSTMMYWSGRDYVVLSSESSGVHYVRATTDGQRLDLVAGQTNGPSFLLTFDPVTRDAKCGAHGCYVYGIKNGALIATRLDETPAGLTATSTTIAPAGDWKHLLAFGPDLMQLAYLRRGSDPAYRLVMRSVLPLRARPVK